MQAVCQFIKCYSSRGGTLQCNWLERRKNAERGGFLLTAQVANYLMCIGTLELERGLVRQGRMVVARCSGAKYSQAHPNHPPSRIISINARSPAGT